jgi:hypothetical protein
MHHYQRKQLRDFLHGFVADAHAKKEFSDLCVAKYMYLIRPSQKNKDAVLAAKKQKH